MTDVRVGIAALLAGLAFVGASALAGTRFRTASDLPLQPVILGGAAVEIVTPNALTPPDLGDGTEVQVDRIISYSTFTEYLPDDSEPARPRR